MQVAVEGALVVFRAALQLAKEELGILNSGAKVSVTVLPVVMVLLMVKFRS